MMTIKANSARRTNVSTTVHASSFVLDLSSRWQHEVRVKLGMRLQDEGYRPRPADLQLLSER
jgi:hypothetical protein